MSKNALKTEFKNMIIYEVKISPEVNDKKIKKLNEFFDSIVDLTKDYIKKIHNKELRLQEYISSSNLPNDITKSSAWQECIYKNAAKIYAMHLDKGIKDISKMTIKIDDIIIDKRLFELKFFNTKIHKFNNAPEHIKRYFINDEKIHNFEIFLKQKTLNFENQRHYLEKINIPFHGYKQLYNHIYKKKGFELQDYISWTRKNNNIFLKFYFKNIFNYQIHNISNSYKDPKLNINFWLKRGYTHKNALIKVKNLQKNINNTYNILDIQTIIKRIYTVLENEKNKVRELKNSEIKKLEQEYIEDKKKKLKKKECLKCQKKQLILKQHDEITQLKYDTIERQERNIEEYKKHLIDANYNFEINHRIIKSMKFLLYDNKKILIPFYNKKTEEVEDKSKYMTNDQIYNYSDNYNDDNKEDNLNLSLNDKGKIIFWEIYDSEYNTQLERLKEKHKKELENFQYTDCSLINSCERLKEFITYDLIPLKKDKRIWMQQELKKINPIFRDERKEFKKQIEKIYDSKCCINNFTKEEEENWNNILKNSYDNSFKKYLKMEKEENKNNLKMKYFFNYFDNENVNNFSERARHYNKVLYSSFKNFNKYQILALFNVKNNFKNIKPKLPKRLDLKWSDYVIPSLNKILEKIPLNDLHEVVISKSKRFFDPMKLQFPLVQHLQRNGVLINIYNGYFQCKECNSEDFYYTEIGTRKCKHCYNEEDLHLHSNFSIKNRFNYKKYQLNFSEYILSS